jgi:hypothetical protein
VGAYHEIKIQLEHAHVPEAEIRLRRLKRRERPIPKQLLQARALEDRPQQRTALLSEGERDRVGCSHGALHARPGAGRGGRGEGGAPTYVSVFAGRVADSGVDPVPLMAEAVRRLAAAPNTELIWASRVSCSIFSRQMRSAAMSSP